MAQKNVLSGSKYHDPGISTTTDPITGKAWSASDRKQVEKLNALHEQFVTAVQSGDTETAQNLLQQRDDILDNADDDVQAGFMAAAMAQLAGSLASIDDE